MVRDDVTRLVSVLGMRGVLAVSLAALTVVLGCGPNALPPRQSEVRTAPTSADSTGVGAAAAPQAPLAQLFGGNSVEGRMLFTQSGDLWFYERGQTRKLAEGYTWRQPRWSPDGSRFAFVYRGNSFSDIFVTDLENKNPTRLTNSQSRILEDNDWNFRPTWSPDGKLIAFLSDSDPSLASPVPWIMNADGTGRRRLLTGLSLEYADEMSWSPDGSTIAMTVWAGGPSQIAIVPVTQAGSGSARGATTRIITTHPQGALDPAYSPDGKWIAFAARDGREVDIYFMSADGSNLTRATHTRMARSPSWSPDGKKLAYMSSEPGQFEVYVADVLESSARPGTLEVQNARQLTHDIGLDGPSGITWTR